MQFFLIQNCKMRLSKKVLYLHFVVFLPCLEQMLRWKHFICHGIALKY